jgi:hypothetical protein
MAKETRLQERRADARPALGRDPRGSVATEYVVLLGTIGMLAVGALVGFGPQLVSAYQHARQVLAQPAP